MSEKKHGVGRAVLAILLAGIWINGFEFLRNQVLLLSVWQGHYRSMGLTFPSAPVNGLMWVVWGFVMAGLVFVITRKFCPGKATMVVWPMAFVLMWIVIWNLGVLPLRILPLAIPMSLVEVFGAAFICYFVAKATAAPPGT
jgi:hypothetical protein